MGVTPVSGATLGIIGFGRIGQAMAHRAHFGFGMKILVHNRSVVPADVLARYNATQIESIDQLLPNCDFVSLHCPGGAANRHLISARRFDLMRPGAFLINTARGALIDDAALVRALEGGILGGIGLDVLDTEPPAPDHPLLRWAKDPRVIVTPHVAWASDEAMQDLAAQVIASIERFVGSRGKTATYDDRR